jgi:FMN phosphatase YigB (HAD superfamily)
VEKNQMTDQQLQAIISEFRKTPVTIVTRDGKTAYTNTIQGIEEYEYLKDFLTQAVQTAYEQGKNSTISILPESSEELAKQFHNVYNEELTRQGRENKWPNDYELLPEEIKDLDRALARYTLEFVRISNGNHQEHLITQLEGLKKEPEDIGLGFKIYEDYNSGVNDAIACIKGESKP